MNGIHPHYHKKKINDSLPAPIQATICEAMQPFLKDKKVETNVEDRQHSHYENNYSSHSPWGSRNSWNKVPKVDMHKFDGSNLVGWVSQMEQYLCNVPTLGHHHSVEVYDDQSSQMGVIASTRVIERHCVVQLSFLIISHHYEPFRTSWLWFHFILMISMILTILSYKSIKFTEEVILGTLLGGTSQCNSLLELGGATLWDWMARSDFQWPGKPQGEITIFLEVKRLIN
jgi:hypothetical protein